MVKNPPAMAGDIRDMGSVPGSERSPGGRHGNPLQYSCLENTMDRRPWRAQSTGLPRVVLIIGIFVSLVGGFGVALVDCLKACLTLN